MILSRLVDYYERKLAEGGMPAPGLETKEIPYVIVVGKDGRFVQFLDTWVDVKRKRAKPFLVPKAPKRANGIEATLLWDNPAYVFGVATAGKEAKPERLAEQRKAFVAKVEEFAAGLDDEGIRAVVAFLKSMPDALLQNDPLWKEVVETGGNLTFRLAGDGDIICARPAVLEALQRAEAEAIGDEGVCLLSGTHGQLARLHPAVQGVRGAQSTGASIVSFNLSAFESYGKVQSYNSPISLRNAFAYTTALNSLLGKDSRQKMQIADCTAVFWCGGASQFEEDFLGFFLESDDERKHRAETSHAEKIRALYEAPRSGKLPYLEDSTPFYMLGLSPNAARLAVRFWHEGTVMDAARHIKEHFEDLKIAHGPSDSGFLSISRLLRSTAPLGDTDRINAQLAAKLMQGALTGRLYPLSVLSSVLARLRSDHKEDSIREYEYPRMALIKAYLNRKNRLEANREYTTLEEEMDPINKDTPYRLGRAFAVLESLQRAAIKGIGATIRDRYFASASTRPAYVFPLLLTHAQHHASKAEGLGVVREKQLQEILETVTDFPRLLSLEEQGRFALGYYHQKQQLFKKADSQEVVQ